MTKIRFERTGQQALQAFTCFQTHVAVSEDRTRILTYVNPGEGVPKGLYALDIADATWRPVDPDDVDLSGMWHVRPMCEGDLRYRWRRKK